MGNSKFKGGSSPVFTKGSSSAALGLSASSFSPRDIKRMSFEVVVVETQDGKIEVIEGIRASAIITKSIMGEYKGILHWPVFNKNARIVFRIEGKPDPNLLVVLEDKEGSLVLKKQKEAIPIIAGCIPQGFLITFVPPQKKRKK